MDALQEQTHEPVIGLDIAPDYIRVVQLERINADYHLTNFGITETPEGCMEGGHIIHPRVMGKRIQELLQERGIKHRRVVTAVRGAKVASRLITLPAMPHDRLRRLIESEIDRYVLFGDDDKIVFYHPMEEFEEDGRRKVSIMLVIAERNLCYSYYQALSAAGLECTALDMSSFAILRVLRNNMPKISSGSNMSLVFDYHGISMNVFRGETIRYSRSLKLNHLDPAELTNGFMDKCLSEVLLALQYYQTEFPRGGPVKKLVVSLGATGGLNLYHMLKDQIEDIPIEMHTPFNNIKIDVDSFPSHLMEQADLSFLTAVGLALRGMEVERLPFQVDLLPADIEETRKLNSHLLALGAALLLLVVVLAGLTFYNHKRATDLYNQNLTMVSSVKKQTAELDKIKQDIAKQNNTVYEAPNGRVTFPGHTLTSELGFLAPKNVQLLELGLKVPDTTLKAKDKPARPEVTLIGIAEAPVAKQAREDFTAALEHSDIFDDLKLVESSNKTIHDRAQVQFTIRALWNKNE